MSICGISLVYLILKIDLIVITVNSVLIVFSDSVSSLQSTIYALSSMILCMDVDLNSYCSKYQGAWSLLSVIAVNSILMVFLI